MHDMKNQGGSTLSKMFSGADNERSLADFDISFSQKCKVIGTVILITAYKVFILPWQRNRRHHLFSELDKLKNLTAKLPNPPQSAATGSCFLSDKDRHFFEENGYLPPYRVLSAEEAQGLMTLVQEEYDNDFNGVSYMRDKIKEIAKKEGRWNIEYASLYQALELKPFRDLMRKPEISEKIASILGDEVICWRNQFFEKKPGSDGTPWHQNATFREMGKYAKLQPTRETPPALIQVNAWVALTDTTKETGCLRILPGSYADARVNYLYEFLQDNRMFYLSLLPASPLYLYHLCKSFMYGRIFHKGAVVFFSAAKLLGDHIFDGFDIKDLEMKAGECLIFSSLNIHASYPNTSKDKTRFSFVGRCTANHVKVAPYGKDNYSTLGGLIEYTLPKVISFQIYGKDTYGYNGILDDEDKTEE
ncbi:phytanoyl-CoA dioxygenase family protein [Microbulbifer sp. JTAC008]|uniref:phytanoyl-CoA dioxygenase family protein n=1 Tax=unclassified Microbulbifer TaxID=2619833 RepID=UPI0040392FE6